MIQDVRAQTMNLPRSGLPALGGKALISAAIVAIVVAIVIVRAAAMSPATNAPPRPTQLASTANADCDKHAWPYVTSACLQGVPDTGEPVRVVTPKPPPDAQTQAREADERYNAAMQSKPQKRKHYGDVTREQRARRNATFF